MRIAVLVSCVLISASSFAQANQYEVLATPATVEWGHYAADAKPAITVHSGDTVKMQTVSTCGSPDRQISRGISAESIPGYTAPIYEKYPDMDKGPGGHILTGPVAVAEAEPGDVLEVQILDIRIDTDYACNGFSLHHGFLPMEYPYTRSKIIPLDRGKMIGHFAPGIDLPLHPFFGSMGVAPAQGRLDSNPPFAHAGNMDNKELVAGTTLYIPVAAKGALFEAGDGHAGQGNGEVDISALETYLTGTFKFVLHKHQQLSWPRAETPQYFITMGFSTDLKEATEHALREMIDYLVTEKHMTRDDAYMLCSVAVDMDITELVDGNVGVHAMLPKKIFAEKGGIDK
jgi:acetamidase/formamidase